MSERTSQDSISISQEDIIPQFPSLIDIQVCIFQNLGMYFHFITKTEFTDLLNVSVCCKQFYKAASSDIIWKQWGNPNWEIEAQIKGWKSTYMHWIRNQWKHHSISWRIDMKDLAKISERIGDGEFKKWMDSPLVKVDNHIMHDFAIKICVEGPKKSGKTTFVKKILGSYEDFLCSGYLNYKIRDKVVRVNIWDANGQHLFKDTKFWDNAKGNLFVYDLSDLDNSLTDLSYSIESNDRIFFSSDTETAIVGNKKDLATQSKLEEEDLKKLIESKTRWFFEKAEERIKEIFSLGDMSALTGERVFEVIEALTRICVAKLAACPYLSIVLEERAKNWPNKVPSSQTFLALLRNYNKKEEKEKKKTGNCIIQ